MRSRSSKRSTAILVACLLFSALGAFDSGKLLLADIDALKTTPVSAFSDCSLNSFVDCQAVSQSEYSTSFGVPNTVIGVAYYAGLFVFFMLVSIGVVRERRWFYTLADVGILTAWTFSVYLIYVSLFVLAKVCLYCLVSLLSCTMITLLFNLAILRNDSLTFSRPITRVLDRVGVPVTVTALVAVLYVVVALVMGFYYRRYVSDHLGAPELLIMPAKGLVTLARLFI